MTSPLCLRCGKMIDRILVDSGATHHPTCEPRDPNEIVGLDLLSDLTDVIRWTDNHSTRSTQASIGPSELGSLCDRRIAYRLAGTPEVNWWSDPLPAIVGTAVHAWLEKAVNGFQAVHHMDRWLTEITVKPDPLVTGHCDLYDRDLRMIIDWKTVSPTKLRAWKTDGPPPHFKDQVSLYAKGAILAGLPVDKVALIAVPRAGFLKDMRVWVGDYDPQRAQDALDRMYGIANSMISAGDDLGFEDIKAAPGSECSHCPWYRGGSGPANLSGCSGNNDAVRAKYGKGLVKDV